MKVLFQTIILVTTIQASATNYYLSDKGNDLQSGTSALAPWRSLKKLSDAMHLLNPGDSILFERGSIFNGELKVLSLSGKSGKEIYLGAYGSGLKPIIRGSAKVNNWTLFRDHIWMADCIDCNTEPANLFIDGQYQSLGRYPNEGYMTLSCDTECRTTLTDNYHAFANGYWDGAEVVVRSSRWTLDNLPVTNYLNKTFYFSVGSSYNLPRGFGYFIQKHLTTLDRPGEWFFDKTSKKIFIYCKNSDSPGNHLVEVSMIDVGLEILNSNFVTIENIIFKYQQKSGMVIKYSGNINIRNCDVQYPGNNGMEINSCQSPTIENCRIMDSNNNGVAWVDNTNGAFVKNFIHRTGLQPGRGNSGNGTYIGLSIAANIHQTDKNLFQFNSIDSVGYLGIDFRTGGTTIKNNLVSNFCMVKDDGAGIYTWGNAFGDNKIAENLVLHGIGCGTGTNDPDQSWVSGIYIDDRSADITINKNTVAYCGTNGVYIHNSKRISVDGNILFGNGSPTGKENAQLCIKRDALVPMNDGEALDLSITGNRFVTFQEGNHCVYLHAEKEQDLKGMEFGQNLYFAPHPSLVVGKLFNHQEMCNAVEELTLSEWSQTGCDKNSQFKLIDNPNGSTGPNLVKNSKMTYSTEGWVIWPSPFSITHDKKIGADAPSLKVLFPPGMSEALLYYAGVSLNSNKWYRLTFSAKSVAKSKIEFVPLMASSPWGALGDYTCFSIDTNFKSFTYVFRPNIGNKNARLNFKSNTSFWIDNVALSEIEFKSGTDAEPLQLLINPNEKPKTFSYSGIVKDADGNLITNELVLKGYDSRILLKNH
jgi:parallel beta-helix repeat protein